MDHLTPPNQARLQDILRYYDNHRRTYYDDNIAIAADNRRREEEKAEIQRHLDRIQEIQTTEPYQELSRKKAILQRRIDYQERLLWRAYYPVSESESESDSEESDVEAEHDEPIYIAVDITVLRETLTTLGKTLAHLVTKQLNMLEAAGVDIAFLNDKEVKVVL